MCSNDAEDADEWTPEAQFGKVVIEMSYRRTRWKESRRDEEPPFGAFGEERTQNFDNSFGNIATTGLTQFFGVCARHGMC